MIIKRYDFKPWKIQLEENLFNERSTVDFSLDSWKENWLKKIEERDLSDKVFMKKVLWISTAISVIITLLIYVLFDFRSFRRRFTAVYYNKFAFLYHIEKELAH